MYDVEVVAAVVVRDGYFAHFPKCFCAVNVVYLAAGKINLLNQ